ncbi:tRNA uridine-5-carboxymethylaminomethyl(34) synthesis GTPase MnmE [Planctomycetota bacterium]
MAQLAIGGDTIVALSTPAGASPAAIVRLSGPDAFPILQGLLAERRGALGELPPYSALDTHLRLRPDGPRVPATLYLMRGPRSYTREDVAEVHTIGSTPLLRMLLDAFVEQGARVAEPGEFTRRAFLNGRIDLAQAEAVLGIIQASTDGELRAATRALTGRHSRHVHDLHDALIGLRAQLEASIDFAEHDIELVAPDDLRGAIAEALAGINDELRNADAGSLPPEGIRVALCGLPNAGKSSLFNALLAHDRAIVTDVPGTTRDAVAEPLTIDGVRFRLYDTAGLFRAPEPTEEASVDIPGFGAMVDAIDVDAVARSRGLIAGTHIALVVLDASQPVGEGERELWAEIDAPRTMLVLSKADLPSAVADADGAALARDAPVLRVSAATGRGLPELEAALASAVRTGQVDASPADLVWNARHRQALRRAREALERARAAAAADLGAEFVAADLRNAHDALAAITGHVVPDDLLDLIFAEFCIGK